MVDKCEMYKYKIKPDIIVKLSSKLIKSQGHHREGGIRVSGIADAILTFATIRMFSITNTIFAVAIHQHMIRTADVILAVATIRIPGISCTIVVVATIRSSSITDTMLAVATNKVSGIADTILAVVSMMESLQLLPTRFLVLLIPLLYMLA